MHNEAQAQHKELTREEIYEIFSRHRGEAYQLAARIKRSRTMVSQVLRGAQPSKYILDAARARALELLAEESAERSAA